MVQDIKEKTLGVLQELEKIELLQQLQGFEPQLKHLRGRLEDDEFRIAVVGEFSSGKSTFINALLGRDILQHATTETTAVLTRIINTAPADPRAGTGKALLRSGGSVELCSLDELKEYTTTASKKFHVADEIAEVEIYLPVMDGGKSIVIVDTPGLNGTKSGHLEQTVSMVQRAHACIYLIQRRGLAESDIQNLTNLIRFQKNFIFVQNFIDDFRRSEGESVEAKLSEQRKTLEEKVFAGVQGVQYRLCGVSALMELASQDQNITRLYNDSTEELTQEKREELARKSNFGEFRTVMAENYQADRLAQIQYGGTALAVCEWIQELEERLSRRHAQVKEVYDASREHRDIEKLERLKQKVLENRPKQEEYLRNFVISYGQQGILKKEQEELEKSVNALWEDMEKYIDRAKDLNEFNACSENIPAKLNAGIDKLWAGCIQRCGLGFDNLSQSLMARIEEYTHIGSGKLSLEGLSITAVGPDIKTIQLKSREKELEKRERDMEKKRNEAAGISSGMARQAAEQRKAAERKQEVERRREAEDSAYVERISRLNARPRAVEVKERHVEKIYRGGTGFLDWLLGPKEDVTYRTRIDDSKGKEWDTKKAKITNEHAKKRSGLERELAAARRRYDSLKSDLELNRSKLARLEEKIRKEERDLAEEKELLAREIKEAAWEFLAVCKRQQKEQIRKHLLGKEEAPGGVLAQLKRQLRDWVVEVEEQLSEETIMRFNEAVERKLADIQDAQEKKSPEIKLRVEKLEQAGTRLIEIREKMEEWTA